MRKNFVLILLICIACPWAEAGLYLGFTAARLNLEYLNVKNSGVVADTQGSVELIGFGGGYSLLSPGNLGFDLGAQVLGTNNEKLNPNPAWGTPWYLRFAGRGNYTFSFGLFFQTGIDLISTTSQEAENHYLGLGILYGLGYRINERASLSLTSTNSSVLFAGVNKRYLRGQVFEFNYSF